MTDGGGFGLMPSYECRVAAFLGGSSAACAAPEASYAIPGSRRDSNVHAEMDCFGCIWCFLAITRFKTFSTSSAEAPTCGSELTLTTPYNHESRTGYEMHLLARTHAVTSHWEPATGFSPTRTNHVTLNDDIWSTMTRLRLQLSMACV